MNGDAVVLTLLASGYHLALYHVQTKIQTRMWQRSTIFVVSPPAIRSLLSMLHYAQKPVRPQLVLKSIMVWQYAQANCV